MLSWHDPWTGVGGRRELFGKGKEAGENYFGWGRRQAITILDGVGGRRELFGKEEEEGVNYSVWEGVGSRRQLFGKQHLYNMDRIVTILLQNMYSMYTKHYCEASRI